jgi:hypothetical protein
MTINVLTPNATDRIVQLHPVTIDDKDLFESYFLRYPQSIHVNTFASMFLWGAGRDHRYLEIDGHLVVCYQKKGQERKWYAPIGPCPEKIILDVLSPSQGYRWTYIDEDLSVKLAPSLPLAWDRDMCDYIYAASELRVLGGKKFSSKRNHLRHFQKSMSEKGANIEVIRLDSSMSTECLRVYEDWVEGKKPSVTKEEYADILDDWQAFRIGIHHYDQLDLMGIGVRVNGRLEAVAIGDMINEDTAGLLFSKANRSYSELTTVVLYEFIRALPSQFTFLNRAIDGGIQGLRVSKEKWHPVVLAKNYAVTMPAVTAPTYFIS